MRVRYKPVCCGDDQQLEQPHYHHSGTSKKLTSCRSFLLRNLTCLIFSLTVIALASLYLGGVLTFLVEEDFASYSSPLEIADVRSLVEKIDQFETGHKRTNGSRINYDTMVEALEAIQAQDIHQQRILPLTQFKDFEFSIDIKPTCQQQWNPNQVKNNNTTTSAASLRHSIEVAIVVKSAVNNYARRHAIRNSWYLNQTLDIFTFKTVFIVGKCHEKNIVPSSTLQLNSNRTWSPNDCEENILREAMIYGDIIQSSGIDSYYNNTIKTYMTLRWLTERCTPDFTLTIDDDYVFEVDNFVDYLLELSSDYLLNSHEPSSSVKVNASHSSQNQSSFNLTGARLETLANQQEAAQDLMADKQHMNRLNLTSTERQSADRKLSNSTGPYSASSIATPALKQRDMIGNMIALRRLSKQYLWAGYLRSHPRPLRSVLSKWYISREEYPYNKYPPFITGGAVLMSFKTVKHLYYATYFIPSFKFDDVYVGILAYKLGLKALHSDNFMCSLSEYMDAHPVRSSSTSCMGVHDIEPSQLLKLWELRKQVSLEGGL